MTWHIVFFVIYAICALVFWGAVSLREDTLKQVVIKLKWFQIPAFTLLVIIWIVTALLESLGCLLIIGDAYASSGFGIIAFVSIIIFYPICKKESPIKKTPVP